MKLLDSFPRVLGTNLIVTDFIDNAREHISLLASFFVCVKETVIVTKFIKNPRNSISWDGEKVDF